MICRGPGADIPQPAVGPAGLRDLKGGASAAGQTLTKRPFTGFAQPNSNATYCPNQFLDVVLPHFSRGVVRLVGYILYRTFAWSDRNGRPVSEQHPVSYRELIERAGISRGAIRQAVDEAVEANLVRRVRQGQAGRPGASGEACILELNWHAGEYTTNPTAFCGFFEGIGHRTYIPNQFFTHLLPNEPLSVLKVVGAVIRFSIGFEVKRGFRRQEVALSYSAIQRYSRIGSREDLARGLKHALDCNYIQRVERGNFDPDAGRLSRAASYGLQWADEETAHREQSKTRTGPSQDVAFGRPEGVPLRPSSIRTGTQSDTRTGRGTETEPVHRTRTRTGIEMKPENEHFKQQQAAAADSDGERQAKLKCLREAGFDPATCDRLALHSLERIQRQVAWMDCRTATRNKLGMLRKAIEEDWPRPGTLNVQVASDLTPVARFARHYYAGLANNKSQPVAHPSQVDLVASERLLQALQTLCSGTGVEVWGLKFGVYVARQGTQDGGQISLATATRRFADAFLVSELAKREQRLGEGQSDQHAFLTAQAKQEYLHYLLREEARMREQETPRYQEFMQGRDKRRTTLLRLAGGDAQSPLLRSFDSDSGRLTDFQTFFSDQVPGLEAWRAHTKEGRQRTTTP